MISLYYLETFTDSKNRFFKLIYEQYNKNSLSAHVNNYLEKCNQSFPLRLLFLAVFFNRLLALAMKLSSGNLRVQLILFKLSQNIQLKLN